MNDERPTVTIMRACEIVGVSRRTIYNWITKGRVEFRRTAGGSIRIYEDSLWRSGMVEPQRPPSAPQSPS